MKQLSLVILVLSLFFCQRISAQQSSEKTTTFIKIWGFLKYYHPEVAKGKIDWDESFRNGIKNIKSLDSKSALNSYYLNWIKELGEIEKCGSCKTEVPATAKFNLDMSWLKDSTSFNPALIERLLYIQKNRNQKENVYVDQIKGTGNPDFKNEKVYKDSIFPSAPLRVLTLARYWNMINYFFPYRYQTDQKWDKVLGEMLPKFESATDTTAYHLAILELTAKIDDSHANFHTKYTQKHFGDNWLSFKLKIMDDKAVVTGFYNDSLSKVSDVKIGDAFLSINEQRISKLIAENSKYIGASNPAVKLRDMPYRISHGNAAAIETEFERDGKIFKKTVPTFTFEQLKYKWGQDVPKDTIKILAGNVGYVNMGNLTNKQVPSMIEKLKNTKAIIFDVRNYPKGTLYLVSNFLNDKRMPFVNITAPDMKHPGTFKNSIVLYTGRKNKDNYKGKVVLLCNENTQSHAEFTLMALQTAPNVTTIGSQTAGADGNVSTIILPGGFKSNITGLGIFYPDGGETQRVGIKVDVVAQHTIKGIREGRDEVMEKALEVIGNK